MKLVVDASVVVKWYVPERDYAEALSLLDDYLDGEADLFAPALLPFEVINALRYSGRYDGEALTAASASLADFGIELRSFARSGAVPGVANTLDVSVYDASYVALAVAVDGVAYTADGTLLSATAGTEYADRLEHIEGYA